MIKEETSDAVIKYDEINEINSDEKLFSASQNSKYGIIDSKGNIILNLIYDDCKTWAETEDYIAFRKENKYALYSINERKFITNFIYENISYIYSKDCFIAVCNNKNSNNDDLKLLFNKDLLNLKLKN